MEGNSDTETLLACIEVFGLKTGIKKCVGMFAIATGPEEKISLIRDRMGEKPLDMLWVNGK